MWPGDTKLEGLTLRAHSIRFEPLLEADSPSVTTVIAEHFIPDEPLLRAAGSGTSLHSAQKDPTSTESAEFWRQTRAFAGSFFITPALVSRPHVSFKVVATAESNSVKEQQVIGVALAHVDYIEPNDKFTHTLNMSEYPFYARPTQTVLELLGKFDPHRFLENAASNTDSTSNNRQVPIGQSGKVSVFSVDLICVVREWRGSGVARAMADHLETLMRATQPMIALTVATNVRSQRLMKNKGYEVVSEANFHEYVVREGLKCTPLEDDPQSVKLMAIRL